MKIVVYSILYKNGHEDVIEQIIDSTAEEKFKAVNDTIYKAMLNNAGGAITLGDSENKGHFIRLSDVSRISMTHKTKLA